MIAAVADADVVLVNPTHVAVALRYEPGKSAPRVVAKGAGDIAARIREEAEADRRADGQRHPAGPGAARRVRDRAGDPRRALQRRRPRPRLRHGAARRAAPPPACTPCPSPTLPAATHRHACGPCRRRSPAPPQPAPTTADRRRSRPDETQPRQARRARSGVVGIILLLVVPVPASLLDVLIIDQHPARAGDPADHHVRQEAARLLGVPVAAAGGHPVPAGPQRRLHPAGARRRLRRAR